MPIPNFKLRSWSMASQFIRTSAMVLLVLDARHMNIGRLSRLEREAGRKLVLVATKSDLIPGQPSGLEVGPTGRTVFHVSAKTGAGIEELRKWVMTKAYDRFARRGRPRMREGTLVGTFDILILGIPNVGKSTLINALTGRRAAPTGFRAGLTRGVQWIHVAEGVRLVDAPGIVDFAMQSEDLALAGSMDVERLHDPLAAAERLIVRFNDTQDEGLARHFEVQAGQDEMTTLEAVARRRGKLLRGGEPDVEEAAKIVVREYQKGKYGFGMLAAGPADAEPKKPGKRTGGASHRGTQETAGRGARGERGEAPSD